jgi:hypothetical protein
MPGKLSQRYESLNNFPADRLNNTKSCMISVPHVGNLQN